MKISRLMSAAAIATLAGQALGQPVIDGTRDAFYGAPVWVQNQPTAFGNNTTVVCDPAALNNPVSVITGVELSIPLSAIGNPTVSNIKICAFIGSGDYGNISNQVTGGLNNTQGNLGDPRALDFSALPGGMLGGVQYISGILTTSGSFTVDGTRTDPYGPIKFTQTVRTGYGDATTATPDFCNGSEMDGLYAVVAKGKLYLLFTGNLESNNNKLHIFIDSLPSAGQNQLAGDNPLILGGGGLNRMGDDLTTPAVEGLKFDTGFGADFYIAVGGEDQNHGTPPPAYGMYVDYARLKDVPSIGDPGVGYYCGLATAASTGALTGGEAGAPAILASINNSNIAGVPALCPPPTGNPDVANGSEIDAVYGKISNGKLYLLVTGNLETSYNKLSLFFDIQPGGQNRLLLDNPGTDFGGLVRMGDDGSGNGMKFDTDFSPDYWLSFTNGGSPVSIFANAAALRTNGRLHELANGTPLDYQAHDGGPKTSYNPIPWSGPLMQPLNPNGTQETNYAPRSATANLAANPNNPTPPPPAPALIRVTIDNSNLAGVSGLTPNSTDPGATGTTTGAELVPTGLELEIALPELTDTCTGACAAITSVKVGGFISNGGYSYLSNQVIGGLPNTPGRAYAVNLSYDPANPNVAIDPRAIDFSQIAGNQYVTITAASPVCYANCDHSTTNPCLNVNDFGCFLNAFASGTTYANCDNSTINPVLNVNDFGCFLNKFASGCSAC